MTLSLLRTDSKLAGSATTTTERSNDKDVAFIAFGDFGDESEGQRNVARAMKKYCTENKCDFRSHSRR